MSIETNYTKISNEFLDALCKVRIPGEARQVLDFIMRKTWGWGKDSDLIPLNQIAQKTGLKKSRVVSCRDQLVAMNILVITNIGNGWNNYKLNTDHAKWVHLPKKSTLPKKVMSLPIMVTPLPKKEMSVPNNGNESYPILGPSKEKKETYSKETKIRSPQKAEKVLPPEASEITEQLIAKILELHPSNRLANRVDDAKRKWPEHIEKLIRLDGRSPPEIHEVIDWIYQDSFWSGVILSAENLREKWDKIVAQKTTRGQRSRTGKVDIESGMQEFIRLREARKTEEIYEKQ